MSLRATITLQAAGVTLNERGSIIVDEYSRTNVGNIYAIGDVTDRLALTPVAIMEGMAFTATAFGGKPTKPIYDNVSLLVLFMSPDTQAFVRRFTCMPLSISSKESWLNIVMNGMADINCIHQNTSCTHLNAAQINLGMPRSYCEPVTMVLSTCDFVISARNHRDFLASFGTDDHTVTAALCVMECEEK